jgi:hypothetical protein
MGENLDGELMSRSVGLIGESHHGEHRRAAQKNKLTIEEGTKTTTTTRESRIIAKSSPEKWVFANRDIKMCVELHARCRRINIQGT